MPNDKKYQVLIVDDDTFLLNMYSVKFKKYGLDVVSAISGQDALSKLREGLKPDIILLDIIMPGMNGFELLENIKKENLTPKSITVVLSNQGQSSDIERAKKLGVHGYIVKATTIPSEVLEEVVKIFKSNVK